MKINFSINHKSKYEANNSVKASLTVEAALVMPMFLFLLIIFLYFIQVFMIQEHIQSGITRMGLGLSKTSYVYQDFYSTEEVQSFDQTIFEPELEIGLHEMASSIMNNSFLKLYSRNYLDEDKINQSCIKNGFEGLSFYQSKILDESDCIDLVVNYSVKIPVRLFTVDEMSMVQRVRLRGWTGKEIAACYSINEGTDGDEDETTVYVTRTGSVYHMDRECSHINCSIQAVFGIPTGLRNESGAKYYSCEACCSGEENPYGTYYITPYGTRYHTRNDCSKIYRDVKAIPLSEVGNRRKCRRCGK